jgi:hypothetical protein
MYISKDWIATIIALVIVYGWIIEWGRSKEGENALVYFIMFTVISFILFIVYFKFFGTV